MHGNPPIKNNIVIIQHEPLRKYHGRPRLDAFPWREIIRTCRIGQLIFTVIATKSGHSRPNLSLLHMNFKLIHACRAKDAVPLSL